MSGPWSIVLVVSGALIGCGGGKTCPPTAPAVDARSSDPAVARIEEHERITCECKTLPCATAARTEMKAWFEGHPTEVTAAMTEPVRAMQIDHHGARAQACRTALYDGASADERLAADPERAEVVKAIAAMQDLTDELCGCPDLRCAESVMKKVASMKDPGGKPTKGEMEQVMKIAERIAGCQKALMTRDMQQP